MCTNMGHSYANLLRINQILSTSVSLFHLALQHTKQMTEYCLAFLDIKISIRDNGLSARMYYS